MQKALVLLLFLFMIVCFIFWVLSHAPSKRNKTKKKATMRKWSTIFVIVIVMISNLLLSQPIAACSIILSFALLDIVFSRIIENL